MSCLTNTYSESIGIDYETIIMVNCNYMHSGKGIFLEVSKTFLSEK